MSLRTITVTEVYCTSCGWAKPLKGSEPPPSKCPSCDFKEPLKGKDPSTWVKKMPNKITDKEDDVFDDWDTYR